MTTHSHRLLRNLNSWNIRKSFSKFFFSPLGLFTLPVLLCARSGGTCWFCFDCAKCLKTPLDVIGDDWTVYFFRLNVIGPKSGYESLVTGCFSREITSCVLALPGSCLDVCAAKRAASSRARPAPPRAPPSSCASWLAARRRSWGYSSTCCWSPSTITPRVES